MPEGLLYPPVRSQQAEPDWDVRNDEIATSVCRSPVDDHARCMKDWSAKKGNWMRPATLLAAFTCLGAGAARSQSDLQNDVSQREARRAFATPELDFGQKFNGLAIV
jgi:hypothetical protein